MRFAVTTFQRVFDTEPNRDVIGLERLVRGLTRFMVKPKTLEAVEREQERIEAAWRAFSKGEYASGKYWSRLAKAQRRGEASGGPAGEASSGTAGDPSEHPSENPTGHPSGRLRAAEKEYRHLIKEAHAGPKRDLRLWSPTLYPAGAKRGGENVIHLSCLVLDYDAGLSIREATERFEEFFHIVHTTWSHQPGHPKFRLILPLAEPVHPADWRRVYEWAESRSDHAIDPTGKSLGTTFALPTVPAVDRPRTAFSAPGPLLDARVEGLLEHRADPPPDDIEPHEPNHFRLAIPGHKIVEGCFGEDSTGKDGDLWDDAAFPWS